MEVARDQWIVCGFPWILTVINVNLTVKSVYTVIFQLRGLMFWTRWEKPHYVKDEEEEQRCPEQDAAEPPNQNNVPACGLLLQDTKPTLKSLPDDASDDVAHDVPEVSSEGGAGKYSEIPAYMRILQSIKEYSILPGSMCTNTRYMIACSFGFPMVWKWTWTSGKLNESCLKSRH